VARAPYGLGAWGHAPATTFRSAAHQAQSTECISKPAALNFRFPAVKKCRRIVAANRRSAVATLSNHRGARLGCKLHPCHLVAAAIEISTALLGTRGLSPVWERLGWRISYPAADAVKLASVRLPLRRSASVSIARKHSTDLRGDVRFFARLRERGRPQRSYKTRLEGDGSEIAL